MQVAVKRKLGADNGVDAAESLHEARPESPTHRVDASFDDDDDDDGEKHRGLSPRAKALLWSLGGLGASALAYGAYKHWADPKVQNLMTGQKGGGEESDPYRVAGMRSSLDKALDRVGFSEASQIGLGHSALRSVPRSINPITAARMVSPEALANALEGTAEEPSGLKPHQRKDLADLRSTAQTLLENIPEGRRAAFIAQIRNVNNMGDKSNVLRALAADPQLEFLKHKGGLDIAKSVSPVGLGRYVAPAASRRLQWKNMAKGLENLAREAEGGNKRAQRLLGEVHENILGGDTATRPDIDKSVTLFSPVRDKGGEFTPRLLTPDPNAALGEDLTLAGKEFKSGTPLTQAVTDDINRRMILEAAELRDPNMMEPKQVKLRRARGTTPAPTYDAARARNVAAGLRRFSKRLPHWQGVSLKPLGGWLGAWGLAHGLRGASQVGRVFDPRGSE